MNMKRSRKNIYPFHISPSVVISKHGLICHYVLAQIPTNNSTGWPSTASSTREASFPPSPPHTPGLSWWLYLISSPPSI